MFAMALRAFFQELFGGWLTARVGVHADARDTAHMRADWARLLSVIMFMRGIGLVTLAAFYGERIAPKRVD